MAAGQLGRPLRSTSPASAIGAWPPTTSSHSAATLCVAGLARAAGTSLAPALPAGQQSPLSSDLDSPFHQITSTVLIATTTKTQDDGVHPGAGPLAPNARPHHTLVTTDTITREVNRLGCMRPLSLCLRGVPLQWSRGCLRTLGTAAYARAQHHHHSPWPWGVPHRVQAARRA